MICTEKLKIKTYTSVQASVQHNEEYKSIIITHGIRGNYYRLGFKIPKSHILTNKQ